MKKQAIVSILVFSLMTAGCGGQEIESTGDLPLVQPESAINFKPTLTIGGVSEEYESYLMVSSSPSLEKDVAEMSRTYNQLIEAVLSETSTCAEFKGTVEEANTAWSEVTQSGGWLLMVGLSSAVANEDGGTDYDARDMESGTFNFVDDPEGDYVWATLVYFHDNPYQIMLDTWDDTLCEQGGEGELWDMDAVYGSYEYMYSRDEGSMDVHVGMLGFDADIQGLRLTREDVDGSVEVEAMVTSAHFSGGRVQEEDIVVE